MDVMFFIHSLKGSFGAGGVQRNTWRLATEFARRGLSVQIVVATTAKTDLPPLEGVRVHSFAARNRWASIIPMIRYLRKHRPKVAIGATQVINCVLVCAERIARSGAQIVLTERTHLSAEIASHGHWTYRLLPALMRRTYPHADAIVAVSSGVADDLAEKISLPRDRIQVVYNPIFDSDLLLHSSVPCPHAWFHPGKPPVILGSGRLVPEKSFDVLLRAFARVREEVDALLVLLGEGRLRKELECLATELGIADSCAFVGHVPNPYPYMRQAKVFVLSSSYEGFGNVLVEAMACGTPVVSTDCPGGPVEILDDGAWGTLVPVGDADAMARAILAVLRSTKHPEVVKRAQFFSVERAADAYLDAVRSAFREAT